MRILVTGMAGFLGYHCARSLAADGHQVLGLDNVNDYYLPALKEFRLAELADDDRIAFERGDLAEPEFVERAFKHFKPDCVLHLAAQAGVRYSLTNPHAYIRSNIVATTNILEGCRHHGKPRLVYASSSSVYGGNSKLPFSEGDRVDHPVSLYAATKKSNELMAHTYTHLYGLQTIGLRFFTVYGPAGRPDMALWLFADAILQNKPIKVFNHGDMYRDFTYVDDIVAGVKGALTAADLNPYEVFNLGNSRCEKLMTLIETLEHCLGKNARKIMLPMQPGDVKATYADISLAAEKLNFKPLTTIEDGVPRFVAWFRDHPQFHSVQAVATG